MALEQPVDRERGGLRDQELEIDRVQGLASGIYGAIVAMGLIDAAEGHGATASEALGAMLVSLAVLWLAHAYSAALAEAVRRGQGSPLLRLPGTLWREWPLLEAGLLPSVALLGGIAGIYSDATSAPLSAPRRTEARGGWCSRW